MTGNIRLALALLLLSFAVPACAPNTPSTAPTGAPSSPSALAPASSPGGLAVPSPAASPASSPVASPIAALPKPTGAMKTVKVGVIGSASDAGVYIALEQGYFAEQGLNVELEFFDSAARMPPAIGTEQIQVGGGALSAGLFNLIARQVPLKIVADKGSMPKGFGFEGMMVRQDLLDSGAVQSPADLKGKKVAHVSEANGTHFLADMALRKAGLTDKDVELITMPFPDMVVALANKSVDAAMYLEPNGTRAEEQKIAKRWMMGDEIYPDHQLAVIFYSPGFVQDTDVARRFAVAYLKGIRDYDAAFKRGQNKPAIIAQLAKHGTVKDPALYEQMIPPGLDSNGTLNLKSIQEEAGWYFDRGFLTEKPDLAKIIDTSFVEFAVQQVGRAP
jgi:NitT/TauT family transport system substrate-binding protein